MALSDLPNSIEGSEESLLVQLEDVLRQEEAALVELEGLITENRSALSTLDPVGLLEVLQRVEQVLGRIGQLEAARSRLMAGAACSAPPSTIAGTSVEAMGPPASTRLLILHHRILGTIARIAQKNQANRELIDSFIKVTGAAIDRLLLLKESNAASFPHLAGERGIRQASSALDIQA